MAPVLRNDSDIIIIDEGWIELIKDHARMEPLRRARLNLHRSEDDNVQEMLIAFCRDSLCAPHRHVAKSESLHVLEGRALICFFDEEGNVSARFVIGAVGTGFPPLYRLSSPAWHTVVPLEDIVVVHEVTMGPFRREQAVLPLWVPQTRDALAAFIERLTLDQID